MQREREKKERAAAKRERRQERASAGATETDIPAGGDLSAADLVRLVEAIHQEYDAGTIDLDTFEEKKAELLARVRVD